MNHVLFHNSSETRELIQILTRIPANLCFLSICFCALQSSVSDLHFNLEKSVQVGELLFLLLATKRLKLTSDHRLSPNLRFQREYRVIVKTLHLRRSEGVGKTSDDGGVPNFVVFERFIDDGLNYYVFLVSVQLDGNPLKILQLSFVF